MDPRIFLVALALPPDNPNRIHPALENAIHYAARLIMGSGFTTHKDYYLAQTRHYMSRSLAEVDRLTHFLWANVILASSLIFEGRVNEAYVTVSSCVKFAIACGLHVVHYRKKLHPISSPLLPPPADSAERTDRAQLSYAIYILDRTLSMATGFPSTMAGIREAFDDPSNDPDEKACDHGEFPKSPRFIVSLVIFLPPSMLNYQYSLNSSRSPDSCRTFRMNWMNCASRTMCRISSRYLSSMSKSSN